jgi:fructokinase
VSQSGGPVVLFGEALVDDFGARQVVGGAPFNVARHLAAFGEPQCMVTRIGNDRYGELVRAEFARFGMLATGLQCDPQWPTGSVAVETLPGGHRFHILPDQAYDHIDPELALGAIAGTRPATLYFGTLAQRGERSRAALGTMLAASRATRFLDLNLRDGQVREQCILESLRVADIVKVNDDELETLFAAYVPEEAAGGMEAGCRALLATFGLEGLAVTLGARGAAYFSAAGAVLESGATVERIADTVGAGDAFAAVFLLGRARGWALPLTLARANAFAAAICTVAGAVPADLAFYDEWKARWQLG